MKIIYLNGPYHKKAYSRASRSPAVTKSGTVYYPIWLAYAVGVAEKLTDYNIELVDAVARKWDQIDLLAYLQKNGPDLVFCDTSTPSITEDINTARTIKNATANKCKVVLVGTHATAMPDEMLQYDYVDAVIRGEYDITAVEMARALADGGNPDTTIARIWKNIAGISLKINTHITHTPDRPLIENLDELPFVSGVYKRHLQLTDYFFAAARHPMVMIITSRGCPHKCKWCLYPQVMHRGRYRQRSSQSVAEEFAFIKAEMPEVQEIGIEDDLFTGNRKRLNEICQLLIKQNNKIPFWCDTRVDLDYESMRLLKAAGCRLLIAGFESASQKLLNNINKGTTPEQSFEFMRNARKANLLVHGCFVLGNPGENTTTMQNTIDLAKKLNPDTVQFFPMMVYPGTGMYNWVQENNYLQTGNYNKWLTPDGLHNSVVDLPDLPGQTVLQYCDKARREFYLRRKYIFAKLTQSLTSLHEAKRNVKAFKHFARYLIT